MINLAKTIREKDFISLVWHWFLMTYDWSSATAFCFVNLVDKFVL